MPTLVSLLTIVLSSGGEVPSEASMPPALARAVEVVQPPPDAGECDALARLFRGWDGLLAFLPLEELQRIEIGADHVDLAFDFGRSGERTLDVPGITRSFWDAHSRRCVRETSAAQRIRMRESLRFLVGDGAIRGIRTGDLRVRRYFRWWDVAVRTTDERRIECDAEGRPRVCTDPSGHAILLDGEPVLQECDRWLVLEAMGSRIEVPLAATPAGESAAEAGGRDR